MGLISTTYELVRQPERHAKTLLDLLVLLAATFALFAFFTGTRPSDVIHKSLVAVGANGIASYFSMSGPPIVTGKSIEYQAIVLTILGSIAICMFLFVLIGGQTDPQSLHTRGQRLALMPWPAIAWLALFLCLQLNPLPLPDSELIDRAILIGLAAFGTMVALSVVLFLLESGKRFSLPTRRLIEPVWTVFLYIIAALLHVGVSLMLAVFWIPIQLWHAINSDQLARE